MTAVRGCGLSTLSPPLFLSRALPPAAPPLLHLVCLLLIHQPCASPTSAPPSTPPIIMSFFSTASRLLHYIFLLVFLQFSWFNLLLLCPPIASPFSRRAFSHSPRSPSVSAPPPTFCSSSSSSPLPHTHSAAQWLKQRTTGEPTEFEFIVGFIGCKACTVILLTKGILRRN